MKFILVCGGRDYQDRHELFHYLDSVQENSDEPLFVVQGGAMGADKFAKDWAEDNGLPCAEVKANWRRYFKRAGYLRNSWMLELPINEVYAFKGGRGTEMMCSLAEKKGIPVTRIGHSEI